MKTAEFKRALGAIEIACGARHGRPAKGRWARAWYEGLGILAGHFRLPGGVLPFAYAAGRARRDALIAEAAGEDSRAAREAEAVALAHYRFAYAERRALRNAAKREKRPRAG